MKNKITDLRDHLFATIEALQDDEKPMEPARAKAISNAAQAIINSLKVEVDFIKATGIKPGSKFVPELVEADGKALEEVPTRVPKPNML